MPKSSAFRHGSHKEEKGQVFTLLKSYLEHAFRRISKTRFSLKLEAEHEVTRSNFKQGANDI
jgi:hypothetical protein